MRMEKLLIGNQLRKLIFLPPLNTKLGPIKQTVKGMRKDREGLKYLIDKLLRMRGAKVREDIFVEPEIKKII